jgi:PEP-CTERM motif
MRLLRPSAKVVTLLGFLLISVTSGWANSIPVRGGSGLGTSSFSFADCLSGAAGVACEAFGTSESGITVTGLSGTFTVEQFVFGNGAPGTLWDVIDLGSVASGTTFSLPGTLFDASNAGVFGCGSGNTGVVDSVGNPMTGPCSQITSLGATDLTLNGDGSLSTGVNFGDLVLESTVPAQVVPTPEPGSLLLLGSGLLSIAGAVRIRRRSATSAESAYSRG